MNELQKTKSAVTERRFTMKDMKSMKGEIRAEMSGFLPFVFLHDLHGENIKSDFHD